MDVELRMVTAHDYPILVQLYDMNVFPGVDPPLWEREITDISRASWLQMPIYSRDVRTLIYCKGSGRCTVDPPLGRGIVVPPITPNLPPHLYPMTLAVYARSDVRGVNPLWTRTARGPERIDPPPVEQFGPCWIRVTFGNGQAFRVSSD